MAFSLSASWNAFRHTDARKLIFEIKELGFEEVELSFNLTASMVHEVEKLVSENLIKISSVHNYCPIPDELPREIALPDHYAVSSCDEQQRQLAVKYSKRSIETAARLQAKAVVLHTGRVEIPDRMRNLIHLFENGNYNSKEFIRLRDTIIKERATYAKPFLENTLKSLEELNRHAKKFGIYLGVETRFYYREIPTFEEIGIILNYFSDSNIFYWHDTGHAQVMENLGFAAHKDFLARYGKSLLGLHLHNVFGCSDHQAPSKGEINFSFIKPYLKKDTLKVIEAHYAAAGEDLKESRLLLEKTFDGRD
jgi:sugar phosphate isomerase/epimerase